MNEFLYQVLSLQGKPHGQSKIVEKIFNDNSPFRARQEAMQYAENLLQNTNQNTQVYHVFVYLIWRHDNLTESFPLMGDTQLASTFGLAMEKYLYDKFGLMNVVDRWYVNDNAMEQQHNFVK